MSTNESVSICTCKGNIFFGIEPHVNTKYLIMLQTHRHKECGELLLKDGRNDLYNLFMNDKLEQVAIKLLDEMKFCPEHGSQSIFTRKN